MKFVFASTLFLASSVDASCPYSALWMKHGPKRAAEILEAKTGRRDIKANHGKQFHTLAEVEKPSVGFGTCEYDNPFSGTNDCIQLSGEEWNESSAEAMCSNAMMGMAKGTLTPEAECPQSSAAMLAGYCFTKEQSGLTEAAPMMLDMNSPYMATCSAVASGCTTWSQGRFAYAGICNADGSMKDVEAASGSSTGGADDATKPLLPPCTLAPGPMGAAHQNGMSEGYRVDCEDAPGRNSPYQWPLRYQAKFESTSLPLPETGRESYFSEGTVYYDLSRNWKRQDTISRGGSLPFVTEDMLGSSNTTVLHRGSEMVFLDHWENGTTTCKKMDMGVIGNIRPDWFMDNRGSATSTQYVGNQHIFHRGKPTLVTQWRKKDFADMYFVMSMAAKPDENGVHWPLQRNDPGEGFGDDNLHSFYEHKELSEDDEGLFLIDQGYDCPSVDSGSDEQGPPVSSLEEEEPSSLNVDEAGWFEFEYTFSPDGPATVEEAMAELESQSGKNCAGANMESKEVMFTAELQDAGELKACINEEGVIEAHAEFESEEEVWVAIGLRPIDGPEFCSMTPANIIMAEPKDGGSWSIMQGPIAQGLHKFTVTEEEVQRQYDAMEPLNEDNEAVSVNRVGSTTILTILHMPEDNEHFLVTWALGKTPTMNYHVTRGCLDIKLSELPSCGTMARGNGEGLGTEEAVRIANTVAEQCIEGNEEGFAEVKQQLDDMKAALEVLTSSLLTTVEEPGQNGHGEMDKCNGLKRRECSSVQGCAWENGVCAMLDTMRRE